MEQIAQQFFNLDIMKASFPMLMEGLKITFLLVLVVVPLGLTGGLVAAIASGAKSRWIRWPAYAFVDFFRSMPPLVLLIAVYAGLPFAGIRLDPFAAVALAFLLNNSAYYGEVYRAGIEAVSPGQTEAARSTGLSAPQTMAYVVLPQAVRNVLPDLVSNTVEVVKLTSLASVVSLSEMVYQADMARSVTYNASPIVLAAGVYLVLLWPVVRLISRHGRKIAS
ncbi:MAG: polar amino acid ABC transporter permease [Rhodobacteraceae bacterium]|nr:polar amino acid ABC transporter permease [Paracoccaceae bacterium]MBR26008.1 polar amino acid ABC transporter permease [Paracoccaceae bacterium]